MTRLVNRALTIFLLCLFLQPIMLQAQTEQYDNYQMKALFDSYKRKQAYDYAKLHLNEMEGDPYFDYYYGVSAIDSNHASEGVFALERVLLLFPDDQLARLELARGYFILQEYAMSKAAFETVLQNNPPELVVDTAQAYLDKIRLSESRYRPTHAGFIEMSLGNDDNANAGVSESLDIASFLTADSLQQKDNFASIAGQWDYTHPITPGWLFESALSAELRQNQELDQFDTQTGTLRLGMTHLQADSKYKAEMISQTFILDGDGYRSLNGLNLYWQYTLSQQSSLNTSLQFAQLDYPELAIRNSDLLTLSVNYTRSFSRFLQPVFFISANLGAENAEDSENVATLSETERDIYSVRTGLVLSFTNTLALQTAIGTQNSSYAGASLSFPDSPREDDYSTADLGLLWAFARKWRLDTRLSYSKNTSNNELREYERNVLDMTVNYTF